MTHLKCLDICAQNQNFGLQNVQKLEDDSDSDSDSLKIGE